MSNAIKPKNLIGKNETEQLTWNSINWKEVERKVYKLQKRIFKATKREDVGAIHSLQKTLISSWGAKVLAVRKVTQDNQGKKTAGVDGIKTLSVYQRLELANNLSINGKSKPVRRIMIPKANKDEMRPLGIPTMEDRAKQALMKLALEPEWEAKFEPHSYGFRPARCTHDANKYIFQCLNGTKGKWILDADIAGCFDNINHQALLEKVNTFPKFRKQIKEWLKCGVIEFSNSTKTYSPSSSGTPQGGVISPLLSNIALHGLEDNLKEWLWNTIKYREPEWNSTENRMGTKSKANTICTLSVCRYADDFVIIHKDKEIIEQAKGYIEKFLSKVGLSLKESKTSIIHSTEGFNFLGVNFKHIQTGEYRSTKSTKGIRTGLLTLVTPSKDSIKSHYRRLSKIVDRHKSSSVEHLIANLNPIITGWTNYFKAYVSKETFTKLDHLLFQNLKRWAKRRHPSGKNTSWIMRKYFLTRDNWKLFGKDGTINLHSNTKISRHTGVKGNASIFDGNLSYWSKRLKKHPLLSNLELKILKRQNGRCLECNGLFHDGDLMELDHIKPRSQGGNNRLNNLQILHRHCHDTKTIADRKLYRGEEIR